MIARTRRSVSLGLFAAPFVSPLRAAEADPDWAVIERRLDGRLGLSADMAGRVFASYRAAERFPMCSTFKVLAVAAVLARVDGGAETLNRIVTYEAGDLLSYAPVSRSALEAGGGTGRMSVSDLCAATLVWSDNTAANLLLASLGGPEGLTAWLRGTGDGVTRLDRTEPTLNTALPGDLRDTTTPEAMRATLGRILLGTDLSPSSRNRLEAWMIACETGRKRLRAGLPSDWTAGDKTGSGDNGTINDVAILRPPGRAPVVVSVNLTGSTASADIVAAAYAEIGRRIAALASAA
ncbi:class A beta-lactamase [Methylobacterium sp. P5_C11]